MTFATLRMRGPNVAVYTVPSPLRADPCECHVFDDGRIECKTHPYVFCGGPERLRRQLHITPQQPPPQTAA